MRNVSDPIREGAEGFLRVQYGAIFKIAIMLALVILLSYSMRPENKTETTGVGAVSPLLMGILASLSFCVGAGCSATAGYISMWVSASTNIRVCSAARRSYGECLEICFRGGAFSAVLCITLCVFGVSMLYFVLSVCFVNTGVVQPSGKCLYPPMRSSMISHVPQTHYANSFTFILTSLTSSIMCPGSCPDADGWVWLWSLLCRIVYATRGGDLHEGR